jgi:hypothetical protein
MDLFPKISRQSQFTSSPACSFQRAMPVPQRSAPQPIFPDLKIRNPAKMSVAMSPGSNWRKNYALTWS